MPDAPDIYADGVMVNLGPFGCAVNFALSPPVPPAGALATESHNHFVCASSHTTPGRASLESRRSCRAGRLETLSREGLYIEIERYRKV